MSLAEVLPAARALDTREKLLLIQALAEDIRRDDPLALIPAGVAIPMWSPIEAYEAAAQLQRLLDESRASS